MRSLALNTGKAEALRTGVPGDSIAEKPFSFPVVTCGFWFLALLAFCWMVNPAYSEPVIILDPYFYRTAVAEPINGSTKTVLSYYDEKDGHVTALSPPLSQPVSELRTLAIAHAQIVLQHLQPKILRDKHGVIVAIRLEDQDPALSSILLIPGFSARFDSLLGKDCLAAVPNRQVIFLFPRLGGDLEEFSVPLRSFYHNSVWPVSTEIFDWRNGELCKSRDLEADRTP